MRTRASLTRTLAQFPYLVYGVHVFDSRVLTTLKPGELRTRPDGTSIWAVTDHGHTVEWEFVDLDTARTIQRNESHVDYIIDVLKHRGASDEVRATVRDRLIRVLVWHEDELARTPLPPKLSTDYPTRCTLY